MNVSHAGTMFVNHGQCALAVGRLATSQPGFNIWSCDHVLRKVLTSPHALLFVTYPPLIRF